jgi:outer membrane protein, heavy metal efflux system
MVGPSPNGFGQPALLAIGVVLTLLTGCQTVGPEAAFDQVRESIEPRLAQQIHWNRGTPEDAEVAAALSQLLEKAELTSGEAIQIALLNNRRLQATYADLGIAQAEVVQAGLLSNPIFNAGAKFPLNGGSTEVTLGITQPFLDVFILSIRRHVAQAHFDATRDRVAAAVLDHAFQTRLAFLRVQAETQRLAIHDTILETTALAHEFAQRLHHAGNITDLHLAQERAHHEQQKILHAQATERFLRSREELNRWMGLQTNHLDWTVTEHLADPPEVEMTWANLESQAVEASLLLNAQRREIEGAAQTIGLTEATRPVSSLELGAEAERDAGDWQLGPKLALALPIFDWGQARMQRALMQLDRSHNLYMAITAEIQSHARLAASLAQSARQRALHYHQILVPLRETITHESLLQYNAMTLGPAELLLARRQQAEAADEQVMALYDYWAARARIDHLLAGHLPTLPDKEPIRP